MDYHARIEHEKLARATDARGMTPLGKIIAWHIHCKAGGRLNRREGTADSQRERTACEPLQSVAGMIQKLGPTDLGHASSATTPSHGRASRLLVRGDCAGLR